MNLTPVQVKELRKKFESAKNMDKEYYLASILLDYCEICGKKKRFWQRTTNAISGEYHTKCFNKKYEELK